MSTKQRVNGPKRRGQTVKAQSDAGLAEVARATSRLWRKHHLSYDQTKYVVERARRALGVEPPRTRRRTVQRLDYTSSAPSTTRSTADAWAGSSTGVRRPTNSPASYASARKGRCGGGSSAISCTPSAACRCCTTRWWPGTWCTSSPSSSSYELRGQRCDDELLSLTTPLLRRHLNPFGRYYFDLVLMRQDGGQLVELPSEPSASERFGP
jgi:hypothetical protein